MSEPFIGVAVASRGIGHIRSLASIYEELRPYVHQFFWCFGEPIPDAQNAVTKAALADARVTHILFWEDDMLSQPGVLAAMVAADAPVVTVQYPLRTGQPTVVRDPETGGVLLTGMGCLLVRREVFAQIADPPFQVEQPAWAIRNGAWTQTERMEFYGGHDGFFSRECLRQGILMVLLPDFTCGHLEAVRLARRDTRTNVGYDDERCYGGDGFPFRPEPRRVRMGDIVYLRSPRGMVIDMDKSHRNYAKKLRQGWVEIKKGEATPVLKAQAQHNAEVVEKVNRAHASDTEDDDDD